MITQTTNANVLVVDDEDGMRQVEQRMLERAGYDVVGARDGAEAIQLADGRRPFDLVIADMAMPVMDGSEMARRLRAKQPDLKVLFVTGYADRLFDSKRILAEGEAYLDKPFTYLGLLEAVSLLLCGHLEHVESEETASAADVLACPARPVGAQILAWD